jgi:hypothetical protein
LDDLQLRPELGGRLGGFLGRARRCRLGGRLGIGRAPLGDQRQDAHLVLQEISAEIEIAREQIGHDLLIPDHRLGN